MAPDTLEPDGVPTMIPVAGGPPMSQLHAGCWEVFGKHSLCVSCGVLKDKAYVPVGGARDVGVAMTLAS